MTSGVAKVAISIGLSCSMAAISAAAQADPTELAGAAETAPQEAQAAPAKDSAIASGAGDIIVTAQKRSERINSVPMAITAASGAQMQARGITSVADLVKLVPGFQFAQTGINAVYTLRGVGFYDNTIAARGAVAVYQDEVALPFSVLSPIATFDLERVEVLKGPQGTLFGQNSTGGAINYIAAKPSRTPGFGISAEDGRFNRGYVEAFVTGPITSTLSARLSAREEFGGDWQQSYTRQNDDGLGQRQSIAGRLQLAWTPAPTIRADLVVAGYRNRSDPQAPQYVGTSALLSVPGLTLLDPKITPYAAAPHSNRAADWDAGLDQYQHDDIFLTSLRVEADISDKTTLTSISGYSDYHKNAFRDVDGTAISNDDFRTKANNQVIQQELRLSSSLGSRIKYVIGGNFEKDNAYQDDRFFFGNTAAVARLYQILYGRPFTGSDDFTKNQYVSKSVFGNVDVTLTDTLTAHGGARYTKLDAHGRGCLLANDTYGIVGPATALGINRKRAALGLAPITIAPGTCYTNDGLNPGEARPTLNEHNVSWRGGLDWKITPSFLLYGNVSKGYKSGSFPQVPGTNTVQYNAATQESVLAYEAGFKVSLFDHRVQFNGAGFYYNYRDKQFLGRTVTTTGVAPVLVNVPKSNVAGGELQVDWNVFPGLQLSAAGTYLSTRIGNFTNYDAFGIVRNFKDNRFPFAPKYQGTVDAQYEFALGSRLSAYVGASATHQSSTNSSFGELQALAIKAYTTVDGRLGVQNKQAGWRLGLYARNLSNAYYWNNVVRANDTIVRYTGMPRTFGVTFSIRR